MNEPSSSRGYFPVAGAASVSLAVILFLTFLGLAASQGDWVAVGQVLALGGLTVAASLVSILVVLVLYWWKVFRPGWIRYKSMKSAELSGEVFIVRDLYLTDSASLPGALGRENTFDLGASVNGSGITFWGGPPGLREVLAVRPESVGELQTLSIEDRPAFRLVTQDPAGEVLFRVASVESFNTRSISVRQAESLASRLRTLLRLH